MDSIARNACISNLGMIDKSLGTILMQNARVVTQCHLVTEGEKTAVNHKK